MAGEEYSKAHRAEEEKKRSLKQIVGYRKQLLTLKMVRSLPPSSSLQGFVDEIERLGHSLSKPFQFSLV